MTLKEIAKRISAQLPKVPTAYSPWAYDAGAKVMIKHKLFWPPHSMTKLEALEYMTVLEGGRFISVYQWRRENPKK